VFPPIRSVVEEQGHRHSCGVTQSFMGCVPHVQRRDHPDGMELPEITRLSNDVDVDVDVEKRPFDATTASTTAFRPSTSLGMWDTPDRSLPEAVSNVPHWHHPTSCCRPSPSADYRLSPGCRRPGTTARPSQARPNRAGYFLSAPGVLACLLDRRWARGPGGPAAMSPTRDGRGGRSDPGRIHTLKVKGLTRR
jgi:hypothetical protein